MGPLSIAQRVERLKVEWKALAFDVAHARACGDLLEVMRLEQKLEEIHERIERLVPAQREPE